MTCLDENAVLALLRGDLEPQQVVAAETHLDECASCRKLVAVAAEVCSHRDDKTVRQGAGALRTNEPHPPGLADEKTHAATPWKSSRTLERGETIGRYLVLSLLGEGGMGVVFSAFDPELDRKVAIKLLKREGLSSREGDDAQLRLKREAQAMARVDHPNVLAVFDVGLHHGHVFLAMEYVEGWTLRTWLRDNKPSWAQTLEVLRQAGAGLLAAHEAGLVHRDFKPDNVLVGSDGRVRVSDFGLARAIEELEGRPSIVVETPGSLDSAITRAGTVLGTPAYMAPEQRLGRPTDARSDQYAFAVTLYEAIYGKRPPRPKEAPSIPPPPADRAPLWLGSAVMRALHADPNQRFPDMRALLAALQPPSTPRRWLFAGTILTLAAAAWGVWLLKSPAPESCSGENAALERVWNPRSRKTLRTVVSSVNLQWGPSVADSLDTELSRWSEQWTSAANATCKDESQQVKGSTALLLRRQCLADSLDSLDVLLDMLASGDEKLIERSILEAQTLPQPSDCLDPNTLTRRGQQVLIDPNRRNLQRDIGKRIQKGYAFLDIGKGEEALVEATDALNSARTLEHAPTLASAQILNAATLAELGEGEKALTAIDDAIATSIRANDDYQAAVAYNVAVAIYGALLGHFEAAGLAAIAGLAHADRLGNATVLRRGILSAEADTLFVQGNLVAAEQKLEQALGLFPANGPQLERLATLDSLGNLRFVQGRLDEASKLIQEAHSIRLQSLGPNHPSLALGLDSMSSLAWAQGRYQDAIELSKQALTGSPDASNPSAHLFHLNMATYMVDAGRELEAITIFDRSLPIIVELSGPHHPDVGRGLVSLAEAHANLGDFSKAEQAMGRAIAIFEQVGDSGSLDLAMALHAKGRVDLKRRRFDDSLVSFKRSFEIVVATMGADYRGAGHALTGVGLAYLGKAQPKMAIEPLREALRLREKDTIGLDLRSETRFALAQALCLTGKESEAKPMFAVAVDELNRSQLASPVSRTRKVLDWQTAHAKCKP